MRDFYHILQTLHFWISTLVSSDEKNPVLETSTKLARALIFLFSIYNAFLGIYSCSLNRDTDSGPGGATMCIYCDSQSREAFNLDCHNMNRQTLALRTINSVTQHRPSSPTIIKD
ncbi:hypothetical protein J6590_003992 [Homalodisca vitripennis]|nr:hypothetical protein J6590_003992 [Homalodisca vitripennis]